MKQPVIVMTTLLALLFGVLSPAFSGQSSAAIPTRPHSTSLHTNAPPRAFDKTRFLAHLAVAAFLIHYTYKKYQQGLLTRQHMGTLIKAAVALGVAYHEMKAAYGIAQGSNSRTLKLLISPINGLASSFSALSTKLRHGDTSGLSAANSQENALQSVAGHTGYGFKDQAPSGFSNF